jgi:ribosomal protein RSM22 (predicted rRNA methylase)
VIYPGNLNGAIGAWLKQSNQGGLVEKTQRLSSSYRKGANSSSVDLAAYMVSRVPATFAANVRVHEALAQAMPEFAPRSLLDIGAGPGTASWAALAGWSSITSITQCEQDQSFAWLAAKLNAESNLEALHQTTLIQKSEAGLASDIKAELVIASYMLAELPLDAMAQVAKRLWGRTEDVLLLIEPGTPQGFARLRSIRDTLLGQGAFVIAPCTHQNTCPMTGNNWCHFKTRVQRSREHMHAKQATVPFEDESFSYLVLSRKPVAQSGGRIIAPVMINKVAATLPLCNSPGLHDEIIASRDKPAYKRAKKIGWGDVWE